MQAVGGAPDFLLEVSNHCELLDGGDLHALKMRLQLSLW